MIFYDAFDRQLHTDREAIPDAPAVYFVKPTEANIKRIAEDCAKPVRLSFTPFSICLIP